MFQTKAQKSFFGVELKQSFVIHNPLVQPGNEIALCQGMKRFLTSPELAEYCGRNAAKLREELSLQRIASEWLEVFRMMSVNDR